MGRSNYHDVHKRFMPADINPTGSYYLGATTSYYRNQPADIIHNHSGFTLLLPFVEQDNLFRQFDPTYPSSNCVYGSYGATAAKLAPASAPGLPANHVNRTVYAARVPVYDLSFAHSAD